MFYRGSAPFFTKSKKEQIFFKKRVDKAKDL
jgi:hypothetical protein